MNHKIDELLSHTGDTALRRRARWILKKISTKTFMSILDIGCGDGFYLHLLCELFPKAKIIGVDNDINALKSASVNLKGKSIKLKYADIYKLEFSANSFDVVILSEVLEHLEDDLKGLQQVYKVLRPKGLVLITVPHRNYPFLWDPLNWILEHIFHTHIKNGFWSGIWNQHLRLYRAEQLQAILKKGGFKKITINKITHYCLLFNHYLINLTAKFLASKKVPSSLKKEISKFKKSKNGTKLKSPFWLLFELDKLNDSWDGKGSAVSLVAKAVKD